MAEVQLIRGGCVDVGNGLFENSDIRLSRGRIVEVGDLAPRASEKVIDATDRLVTPGLINAHTHSNEMWLRSRFDNIPLEVWLAYAYPQTEKILQSPEEIYIRTALAASEMVRTGTTAVVDCVIEPDGLTEENLDAVWRAYRDVGMRALLCLPVTDIGPITDSGGSDYKASKRLPRVVDAELSTILSLAERYNRPDLGIAVGLAPLGIHRCSDKVLTSIVESNYVLHIHLAESRMQAETALGQGQSLVQRASDLGILNPRTHLSHAVWVSDSDIELIGGSGATVIHNPASNLKLGNGVAPLRRLADSGVSVALGTDGVCTGDSLDLFQSIRLAALLHKGGKTLDGWLGAKDAWRWATVGGGLPLGLGDQVGRIAVGAVADFTLFDMKHHTFVPMGDPVLHLGLGAPTAAVSEVIVGGRIVFRDGQLQGVDERSLYREATTIASSLELRVGKSIERATRLEPHIRSKIEAFNRSVNEATSS